MLSLYDGYCFIISGEGTGLLESGNSDEPDVSLKKAIEFDGRTAVITDSGDNCGAGSQGKNMVILREI